MLACRATGSLALVKLGAPQPDELGFAKKLALEEIGGTNVVVLQQDASQGQVSLYTKSIPITQQFARFSCVHDKTVKRDCRVF